MTVLDQRWAKVYRPLPMNFETLVVEVDGSIARLTLNRPDRLNAMNSTMLRELAEAARWFDTQPDVRVGRDIDGQVAVHVLEAEISGPGVPQLRSRARNGIHSTPGSTHATASSSAATRSMSWPARSK